MKKIPKRYRPFVKPQYQAPEVSLIGMTFKWNERVWVVIRHDNRVAFIRSGNVNSQIELKMLVKVAEDVRAA